LRGFVGKKGTISENSRLINPQLDCYFGESFIFDINTILEYNVSNSVTTNCSGSVLYDMNDSCSEESFGTKYFVSYNRVRCKCMLQLSADYNQISLRLFHCTVEVA